MAVTNVFFNLRVGPIDGSAEEWTTRADKCNQNRADTEQHHIVKRGGFGGIISDPVSDYRVREVFQGRHYSAGGNKHARNLGGELGGVTIAVV